MGKSFEKLHGSISTLEWSPPRQIWYRGQTKVQSGQPGKTCNKCSSRELFRLYQECHTQRQASTSCWVFATTVCWRQGKVGWNRNETSRSIQVPQKKVNGWRKRNMEEKKREESVIVLQPSHVFTVSKEENTGRQKIKNSCTPKPNTRGYNISRKKERYACIDCKRSRTNCRIFKITTIRGDNSKKEEDYPNIDNWWSRTKCWSFKKSNTRGYTDS